MKYNFVSHVFVSLLIPVVLLGCASKSLEKIDQRANIAMDMFRDRCQGAGEKIYKTVKDVDGVFLMNLRPLDINFSSQYETLDPYGRDLQGEGYIETFLRGSYQTNYILPTILPANFPAHLGYSYVEAVDPVDQKRYRYTGQVNRPGLNNDKYSRDATRFLVRRSIAEGPGPRYGILFTDISTREERSYWIAGSSLKVVALNSGEIIAERIGYMVDKGQGNTTDGRLPWLWAANNSCPSFGTVNAFSSQPYQAETFVAKVLRPSEGK